MIVLSSTLEYLTYTMAARIMLGGKLALPGETQAWLLAIGRHSRLQLERNPV